MPDTFLLHVNKTGILSPEYSLTVIEGHNTAQEVERCLLGEIEDLWEITVHIDPVGTEDTP